MHTVTDESIILMPCSDIKVIPLWPQDSLATTTSVKHQTNVFGLMANQDKKDIGVVS